MTVDTVWLRRIYLLAFISIGSRRVEHFALTDKPDTAWMLQQARNLLTELNDRTRPVRFLIHDRDAKFPRAFDSLLASGDIKVTCTDAIRTVARSPPSRIGDWLCERVGRAPGVAAGRKRPP